MSDYSEGTFSSESRLVAALCYLVPIVVSVLVLVSDLGRQRFLRYHGYQGLAAGVVLVVLYVLAIPASVWVLLHIPCIGWAFACLAPFIYLAGFGLQLYWAYLAYQGHVFSIPILGNLASSNMGE